MTVKSMKNIITRPDFDGVVCAVLLIDAEKTNEKIKWTEPNEIQNNRITVESNDIIANLPYNKNCYLWFDHHLSNEIHEEFNGRFEIAPSAAGLIYKYYKEKKIKFNRDYSNLVNETDRIDSANLTKDEILNPEKYPYVALSMTVSALNDSEEYWNRVVHLLGKSEINTVVKDKIIKKKIEDLNIRNSKYKKILLENTTINKGVTITDLRKYKIPPSGNRFLVFSLFPQSTVNVKIRYNETRDIVIASVGHSIFNRKCVVNSGILVAKHGGGGHFGAGSCNFPAVNMEEHLKDIIDTLVANKPENQNN